MFIKMKVGDLLIYRIAKIELDNGKVFEIELDKYGCIETDEAIRYEYRDAEEHHVMCFPKNRIVSISEHIV